MKKLSVLLSMILFVSTLITNAHAGELNSGPDDPPQVACSMMVAVNTIPGITVTEVHVEIIDENGGHSYYSAPYSGVKYTEVIIPGPNTGTIIPSAIAFAFPGLDINYTVNPYIGSWPVPNYANKMNITFY